MSSNRQGEIKLSGIGASPGICIGKAYLVDREGVELIKKYFLKETNLAAEINRFKGAVKSAKDELDQLIADTPEDLRQHAYILESYTALLKDKMLYGRTIEIIENERVNAEWALKKATSHIKSMFAAIADPYLRERATDIIHLSDRIMLGLIGAEPVNIGDISKPAILVAHDLSPAQTSQIRLDRIKGFVTDRGSKTSHTGIVARALELPATLGVDNATTLIKNDDLLVLDGTTGVVIINPDEKTLFQYEERQTRYREFKSALIQDSHLVAETVDGFQLPVMGNLELPEEIPTLSKNGADGIGLYRTEFQYLSRSSFPDEQELFAKYHEVVVAMAPKPVTIRTLDINGDKSVGYASSDDERNPALGLRGIRYCLHKTEVFKTQLRAILRAAAFGYVRLMFPMISTCHELRHAKRLLSEVADDLEREGADFNRDIEIGILLEVPSALIMADVMAEECDFFSIGTNDLIQYIFAIDRENKEVLHLYDPLHPAIIRMIKQTVTVARAKGVKVYMCGEMAAEPRHLPMLLGLGIDEVSMNPQSIPAVKKAVRTLSAAEARRFVDKVSEMTDPQAIAELVEDTYGKLISQDPYIAKYK